MHTSRQRIATEIRKDVVRMHQTGTNVGSAMSVVDILTVLYFSVMRIDSPLDAERDICILSKGHAVAALYSTLAHKGFFSRSLLDSYLRDGSALAGHPSRSAVPGVEAGTGSLGHGLPIAVGMAMAAQQDDRSHRIFVVMGDGEIQEGSVWEGAMLASSLHLDNIVAIVDANGLQGYGRVADRMPLDSLLPKWRSFGWEAVEVDGHDLDELTGALEAAPFASGRPSVVVARTIKGKGIREMEDELGWHYFSVPPEKVDPFLRELESDT